jgi:uncharacterized RDD family membrane protein YckC
LFPGRAPAILRAVPELVIETAEGVRLRREIAGAGSRFAATALDLLLLIAGYLLVVLAVALLAGQDPTGAGDLVLGVLVGGMFVVAVLYQAVFLLLWRGESPGKRALGLRVVSADGYPAGALQIVIRSLIWPLDLLLMVPLPLGFLLAFATERHQRLGDLAAGTLAVRARTRAGQAPEPFAGELWSALAIRTLPLSPGMAARITAHDVDLLRDLWTRSELAPEARRRLFVDAARTYARRLGLGDFEDARVVLKELYLFARESLEARAR